VRCAINNRVCRVCLSTRRGFARVALIAASGLFLTPLPALAGLCAPVLVRLCLLPVFAPPASSRIFASSLVTASSCPPPTPPPPPLRQHLPASAALSAFALAASRSDSLSAFASSRSRGDRGSLVQLHHLRLPAGNELAQCTASGRQHSAAGALPHNGRLPPLRTPTMRARTGLPPVPARSSSANFRSSSARIRSSSAESFCSSDTIFSSPSRSFSSRYSRARADSSRVFRNLSNSAVISASTFCADSSAALMWLL
jgi:hypothetical protein